MTRRLKETVPPELVMPSEVTIDAGKAGIGVTADCWVDMVEKGRRLSDGRKTMASRSLACATPLRSPLSRLV